MTLTREDLLAISDLFDSRMEVKLQPIKEDIHQLKDDMAELKAGVKRLEERVQRLEDRMQSLEGKVQKLDDRVTDLEETMGDLRRKVTAMKISDETEVLPRLQNIESSYLSTFARYRDGVDQIDTMQDDIDVMKNVIMNHSEMFQKLPCMLAKTGS